MTGGGLSSSRSNTDPNDENQGAEGKDICNFGEFLKPTLRLDKLLERLRDLIKVDVIFMVVVNYRKMLHINISQRKRCSEQNLELASTPVILSQRGKIY